MVPLTMFVNILVVHLLPRQLLDHIKGFQDGARIPAPSPQIVHLAAFWIFGDLFDSQGDVIAMDMVTNLLTLVTKDAIGLTEQLDFDQIGQEPVEFHGRVMGPR